MESIRRLLFKKTFTYVGTSIKLAVISAILTGAASLTESKAENITDSVNSAILNNPSIVKSHAEVNQAQANVLKAKSALGPTVGVSSNARYYSSRSHSSTTFTQDASRAYSLTTTFRQPIDFLSGGRASSDVSSKVQLLNAANASLSLSNNELIFDTIQVYSDLLYAKEVIILREKSLSILEEELRAVKEKILRGEASTIELLQTQMRFYEARVYHEEAKADHQGKIANYVRVVGREPFGKLMPIPHVKIKEANLAAVQKKIIENNKQIKSLEYLENAGKLDTQKAKAAYAPVVDFSATHTYSRVLDTTISTKRYNNITVALNLSLDLVDSGLRSAEIDRLTNVEVQRQGDIQNQKQVLLADARSLWERYQAGKDILSLREQHVKVTQEKWYGINQKRLLNEVTELQVLDAENDVVNAEVALSLAQRNLITYGYQLLLLMGELDIKKLS